MGAASPHPSFPRRRESIFSNDTLLFSVRWLWIPAFAGMTKRSCGEVLP